MSVGISNSILQMPTNLEYAKLVELLNKSDNHEIYEELMKKEEKVLDTVNRVVNFSNEKEVKSHEFTSMSIDQIVHKFYWNMNKIFSDISSKKVSTIQDVGDILLKDDRKIYLGILLVLICIFLFFVLISK
jgi:hypothetical protein